MENNKAFQIKYKNIPFEINTHFNNERSALRLLPLETVGDLVAAFFPNNLTNKLAAQYSLHSAADGPAIPENTLLVDIKLPIGSFEQPLIIRSAKYVAGIRGFLSNILPDIEKALIEPSTSGIQRNNPKTLKVVGRWENFITEAATYEYPTTPIGIDVFLPIFTELKFQIERDVDFAIQSLLLLFNRILRDQGKACRFESKVDVFPCTPETATQVENHANFIGAPDTVLTLEYKVLSFVENKTPTDLPVRHHHNGQLFDLLEIYKEDIYYKPTDVDIGRTDVRTLIDQVYGYLSLNNLMYGCVTCYDATYFLWRPCRDTLYISHPIYNHSPSPTLLQSFYYFVHIVLRNYEKQMLDPSPKDSDFPEINNQETDIDGPNAESSTYQRKGDSKTGRNKRIKYSDTKRTKYNLDINSLWSGTVVAEGAIGQVIRLKDSNIVVKCCDSYNNPKGFKRLLNEIAIYEKLSKLNLRYIPRYYGACEFYGQYFIALEFIPGKLCDWRTSVELKDKLDFAIRDLKSFGVVHQELGPDNVLLTHEGDIKLIDFGKAKIQ